jgi:hypothetical protein
MSLTCGKGSMSLPFAQLLEPAGACTSTPIPLGSAQWNKSGRTNQNEQIRTEQIRTSMIGNSQGEAEIPHDLAEGVLPTGKVFA